MSEEKWLPVIGREDQYEVSNLGRLRKKGGCILGQWKKSGGYPQARFSGPRCIVSVHRIVAQAFCDNPGKLPCVNHIDCNPSNNNASNLEWCTQKQNLHHSHRLGRVTWDYNKGKRSANAHLSDEKVSEIRADHKTGTLSWERLGKKHNVSKRTIGRIVRNKTYV